MIKKYTLTIGIPTYNGAKTIKDTLNSVVAQFDEHILENIEVLISNNKSTDNVVEIVDEYIDLFPNNIRLITNERYELKLDGNLINLFNNAQGEYLWIMSDDDAFEVNAFQKVLEIIKEYKNIGVIFSNYSECDASLNYLTTRLRDDIVEDSYCANGDEFFIKSKVLFGLISSLVFNVKDWQNANLQKYIGLNSLHVGALIEILSGKTSYIISDKLVKLRTGNTTWGENGTFILVGFQLIQMFHHMKYLNYKKYTIDYIIDYFYTNSHINIIKAKIKGLSQINKVYIEMKKCYGHKLGFWLLDVPLLYLPKSIYIFLFKIYTLGYKK